MTGSDIGGSTVVTAMSAPAAPVLTTEKSAVVVALAVATLTESSSARASASLAEPSEGRQAVEGPHATRSPGGGSHKVAEPEIFQAKGDVPSTSPRTTVVGGAAHADAVGFPHRR